MFRYLWLLVLAAVLAGCVSEPTRLPLGTDRAAALERLGKPTSTYALPGGGERLQYSRAPSGYAVTNIDIDANGKVFSIRQELFEGLFDSTIKPGQWRTEDVLRTYGRPFEISRVTSFDGDVWAWHFKSLNNRRLLYIYIDPTGVVDHYHTADELFRDTETGR
jgi:hypothetical protein